MAWRFYQKTTPVEKVSTKVTLCTRISRLVTEILWTIRQKQPVVLSYKLYEFFIRRQCFDEVFRDKTATSSNVQRIFFKGVSHRFPSFTSPENLVKRLIERERGIRLKIRYASLSDTFRNAFTILRFVSLSPDNHSIPNERRWYRVQWFCNCLYCGPAGSESRKRKCLHLHIFNAELWESAQ